MTARSLRLEKAEKIRNMYENIALSIRELEEQEKPASDSSASQDPYHIDFVSSDSDTDIDSDPDQRAPTPPPKSKLE